MDSGQDDFKEWMRNMFNRNNITKYRHYFEPWFNNLTEAQIMYFTQQKKNIENGSLTNWMTKK